jgi:hypothetical protein
VSLGREVSYIGFLPCCLFHIHPASDKLKAAKIAHLSYKGLCVSECIKVLRSSLHAYRVQVSVFVKVKDILTNRFISLKALGDLGLPELPRSSLNLSLLM